MNEKKRDAAESENTARKKQFRARRSVEELRSGEKINIGFEKKPEENLYYKKVSLGYRVLKFFTLFVLIVYIGVMFGMYHSEITYDNFMYLIKDLDTDIGLSNEDFATVSFDEGSRVSLSLYRNRLAVCSTDQFKLYNNSGAAELNYTHSMEYPGISSGDKYVLVYDIGGKTYSVYTTIARVLSKESDFEIQSAAMSKAGEYAICSRARENRYVVSFYDRNFRELSKVYKDKYVMTTAISDDGKNYCIASFEVKNSDFVCEVMFGALKSAESYSVTVDGAMPLKSQFFSDGSFVVICDTVVLFFDSEGALKNTYNISGVTLSFADIAYDKVLICGKENIVSDNNTVLLLDKSGNMLTTESVLGKISCAALGENHIFEAVSGSLRRVSFDGDVKTDECALSIEKLIPMSNSVLVCTSSEAKTVFGSEVDVSTVSEGGQ